MYSKALESYPDKAIKGVIEHLATTKREEFEPKIPALPDFLEMVKRQFRKDNPWVPCGDCGTEGLVSREVDGRRVAVRCECFNAWKRRTTAELPAS